MSTSDVFPGIEATRSAAFNLATPDKEEPETIEQPADVILDRVVCLRPIDTFNSTPNRGDQQFRMAINNRNLPRALGLDRSHGPATSMAAGLRATHPNWSNSDIFIEVAHRLGSFVSYSLIAPSAIRVWTKCGPSYNPGNWPRLIDTEESQVLSF